MADIIAIAGDTGSGKSTSIKNLNPQETFIVSILGKPLPFPGYKKKYIPLFKSEKGTWEGNYFKSNNIDKILQIFIVVDKLRPEIKQIVIDDSNYLMSCETMDRVSEKGYEKFTQIASHYYNLIMGAAQLRDDLKIIFLSHTENVGDVLNPKFKLKTSGKMLDNTVNVDGLFTYVLYTELHENDEGKMERVFRTNTIDGTDSCKTPLGCFKDLYIPNDLTIVIDRINKYNDGEIEEVEETENKEISNDKLAI